MKPQFYLMGSVNVRPGSGWPHWIALCFEPIPLCVGIAEGIGQGAGGRLMTATEAISGAWDENFRATRSEWLIPYLRALANSTPLPREEILARYQALHGRVPGLSDFGECSPPESD
jgi:hypothetical protein